VLTNVIIIYRLSFLNYCFVALNFADFSSQQGGKSTSMVPIVVVAAMVIGIIVAAFLYMQNK
jgi:hypothetical protein